MVCDLIMLFPDASATDASLLAECVVYVHCWASQWSSISLAHVVATKNDA